VPRAPRSRTAVARADRRQRGDDAAHEAGRRDALDHPHDGQSGWYQRSDGSAHLASVRVAPRVDRVKQWKDPRFVETLRDIVGLYLYPPAQAVVFSVDEKSNIQALDRTRPVVALQPHVPEGQTHDSIRHGTTTLFAALRLLDGVLVGECPARHRSKAFIGCLRRLDRDTPTGLDLQLIVDNASTHTSPPVRRWLARHPRVHVHFTPTRRSWLNLVERWFAEITRTRLRRGTFESLPARLRAIRDYLDHYNRSPKPFVWTKDADTILRTIARVSNR